MSALSLPIKFKIPLLYDIFIGAFLLCLGGMEFVRIGVWGFIVRRSGARCGETLFVLVLDSPPIKSCLQLSYASIYSVLALLIAILQFLMDEATKELPIVFQLVWNQKSAWIVPKVSLDRDPPSRAPKR